MTAPELVLNSMLVHTVDVYHQEQSTVGAGDLVDGWTAVPDIDDMACWIVAGGKELMESPVGYAIESDALLWCRSQDIRELDKVVWGAGNRTFTVNGTPNRWSWPHHPTDQVTPLLMEVGLKELKRLPG